MSLLLKINPLALGDTSRLFQVTVSKQKSVKDLDDGDIDSDVFVWVTDLGAQPAHLEMKARLLRVTAIETPQKRDPDKTVSTYCIQLERICSVKRTLETDDLSAFRDDPEASPMHELGKIHKDRNEKIIRIDESTRKLLEVRI